MLFKNVYKYLEEEDIKSALLREIKDNGLSFCLPLFNEAWESKFWREKGYDGATATEDEYHPRLANFIHDYAYRCGMANKEADVIYRELLKLTGTSVFKADRRYYLIRTLGAYYRIKHYLKEGKQVSNENQRELFKKLRNF